MSVTGISANRLELLQIADAVGVHETTVSRAISGKYISTPQGVFEMKYFFTPGYQTSSGVSMSNTSVKEAIMDLLKSEAGGTPLSDKEIVEILSDRGIGSQQQPRIVRRIRLADSQRQHRLEASLGYNRLGAEKSVLISPHTLFH